MGRKKKVEIIENVTPTGWVDGAMPKPISALPTAPDPTPKVTQQETIDPEPIKHEIKIAEKKVKKISGCYDAINYKGFSFLEALRSIGIDASFINRKKIAEANGITNYLGLGKDNKELLEKLIKGELKRP